MWQRIREHPVLVDLEILGKKSAQVKGIEKFKSHETGLSSEHLRNGQKTTLLEWKETVVAGKFEKV